MAAAAAAAAAFGTKTTTGGGKGGFAHVILKMIQHLHLQGKYVYNINTVKEQMICIYIVMFITLLFYFMKIRDVKEIYSICGDARARGPLGCVKLTDINLQLLLPNLSM